MQSESGDVFFCQKAVARRVNIFSDLFWPEDKVLIRRRIGIYLADIFKIRFGVFA